MSLRLSEDEYKLRLPPAAGNCFPDEQGGGVVRRLRQKTYSIKDLKKLRHSSLTGKAGLL
jgi:hypothetical protein